MFTGSLAHIVTPSAYTANYLSVAMVQSGGGGGIPDVGIQATFIPRDSLNAGGKLWQDASETVPADADGDPVRVLECVITGCKWVATSDAHRGTLTDLGDDNWGIDFGGVSNYHLDASGFTGDPKYLGMRLKTDGVTVNNAFGEFMDHDDTAAEMLYPFSDGIYEPFGTTVRADSITPSMSLSIMRTYDVIAETGGAWGNFLDGVSQRSKTGSVYPGWAATLVLGYVSAYNIYWHGVISCIVLENEVPTGGVLTATRDYITGTGAEPPPLLLSATVDTDGITLTLVFSVAVNAQDVFVIKADGVSICNSSGVPTSGDGTTTLTYDLTDVGTAAISGTTLTMDAPLDVWTSVSAGVSNIYMADFPVTNNSEVGGGGIPDVGIQATFIPRDALEAGGKLWQDLAETVPADADGDPVAVVYCLITGRKWVVTDLGYRGTLLDLGDGAWGINLNTSRYELDASGFTGSPRYQGMRLSTSATTQVLCKFMDSGDVAPGSDCTLLYPWSSGVRECFGSTVSSGNINPTGGITTKRTYDVLSDSDGSWGMYWDGVAEFTKTGNTNHNWASTLQLGYSSQFGSYFNGIVSCVVLENAVPTGDDLTGTRDYITGTWPDAPSVDELCNDCMDSGTGDPASITCNLDAWGGTATWDAPYTGMGSIWYGGASDFSGIPGASSIGINAHCTSGQLLVSISINGSNGLWSENDVAPTTASCSGKTAVYDLTGNGTYSAGTLTINWT